MSRIKNKSKAKRYKTYSDENHLVLNKRKRAEKVAKGLEKGKLKKELKRSVKNV